MIARLSIVLAVATTACSGTIDQGGLGEPRAEAEPIPATPATDSAAEDVVAEVPSVDAAPEAPDAPDEVACERAFFNKYFDRDNGVAYSTLGDESFARIAEHVAALEKCGASITLGGMLSLMIYEGGGAKVAFFNDRCSENSYDKSATCWTSPRARYSYQYGLAPVHTSNFHPCADVAYTSKMRARLQKAIVDAGFTATPEQIASVEGQVKTFCPSSTATLVDYFILGAHSAFDIPRDASGNDLKNAGKFPFFTPRVVIDLFFATIAGACGSLSSDERAIAIFGGGDASYSTASKQATILKLWRDFRATQCPE